MVKNGAIDLQRWRDPPIYRMLSPGTLLSGEHLNKVWRGMAQKPMNTEPGVPMIIKWVEKKEMLATEMACALAARALRLPVPVGVLVLGEKDQLHGLPIRVTTSEASSVICFGSEFHWPDDTIAIPEDTEAAQEWVWSRLCQSSQGSSGGVWDELIANEDRHHQNVVFDGIRWWFIDHEKTLTPLAKFMMQFAEATVRQTIVELQASSNPIASEMVFRRPTDHGMEALPKSLVNFRSRLRWLIDQATKWKTGVQDLDTIFMMTEFYLRSIDLRLPALSLHLSTRLSKPPIQSLWYQYSE